MPDPSDPHGHWDHAPTPDDRPLPDELRAAAADAEAAMTERADAARQLADAIDPKPSVADLVGQLDATEAAAQAELRTDTTDQAPDPNSAQQAAEAAAQLGTMPPGSLALLGPEVGSQVRHQVLPDGTAMLVLRLEHASGSTIVGLSLGHAMTLSNNLRSEHRKAELATRGGGNGKLIVPNGMKLPPPGDLRAPGQ